MFNFRLDPRQKVFTNILGRPVSLNVSNLDERVFTPRSTDFADASFSPKRMFTAVDMKGRIRIDDLPIRGGDWIVNQDGRHSMTRYFFSFVQVALSPSGSS